MDEKPDTDINATKIDDTVVNASATIESATDGPDVDESANGASATPGPVVGESAVGESAVGESADTKDASAAATSATGASADDTSKIKPEKISDVTDAKLYTIQLLRTKDGKTYIDKEGIKVEDKVDSYKDKEMYLVGQQGQPNKEVLDFLKSTEFAKPAAEGTAEDATEAEKPQPKDQSGGRNYVYLKAGNKKKYPKNVTFSKKNPRKSGKSKSVRKLQNIVNNK